VTSTGRQARLAILLAGVAGSVDAACYLVLHRTFVAHVTGNTNEIGHAVARGRLAGAAPVAVAVLCFAVSITVATVAIELATRRRWRSPTAVALAFEALLVSALMAYGQSLLRHGTIPGQAPGGFYAPLVLAVSAMGLQAAAVTK
jgi:uncharacterized membrane protein YoaK (UPF0700 family)